MVSQITGYSPDMGLPMKKYIISDMKKKIKSTAAH